MTTNDATPREALWNTITSIEYLKGTLITDAVIEHLWEQVDSYDFFDALEEWVQTNDNHEPEMIAKFTAEYLLGPQPQENDNGR